MGSTSEVIWSICALLVVLLLFVIWARTPARGRDLVGYITCGLAEIQRPKQKDPDRRLEPLSRPQEGRRSHHQEEEPQDLSRPRPLSEHLLQLQHGQMEYGRQRSRPPRTKQSGSRTVEGSNRPHRAQSREQQGRSRRSTSNTVTVDGSQTLRDSPMPRSTPAVVTAATRQSRRQSTCQPVSYPQRSQEAVPIASEPQTQPEIDPPFVADQGHDSRFD
jgi:hypothetical protein